MKNKALMSISLLGILLFSSCNENKPPLEYTIIPEPHEIRYDNGIFPIEKNISIAFHSKLNTEANLLKEWLFEDLGISSILLNEGQKSDIILSLNDTLLTDKPESYRLNVNKKHIKIEANNPQGILHGIQTLRQIIKEDDGNLFVQKGTITDFPAMSWRAFMLDEARYFKGKEVVYDLLDEMSQLKMNTFHWHLTNDQGWRIQIKKYPLLTEIGAFRDSSEINDFGSNVFDGKPHGGFYTQDEIKEIVKYASDRHIQIVPEISMPGHATAAVAAYPWLGTSGKSTKVSCRLGVMYEAFNVADPRVIQFFDDVLDEVISLFPSPVIHIGGDEVRYNQWNNSPTIQAYMKENGLKSPPELQVFFTNKISNLLKSKNRTMMGWNEITGAKLHEYQTEEDKATSVSQELAPGSIVHFWKGDTALIKQTIEKGYDIVNSYHSFTYIDYGYHSISLEKAYSFNPVPDGLTKEQQKKVLGLGCQMWGELTPTVESINIKIFPRIAAYAETGWVDKDKKDYERFLNSLENYFIKKWNNEKRLSTEWKPQ